MHIKAVLRFATNELSSLRVIKSCYCVNYVKDTKIRHRVDLAYVVSKNCIAGDQFSSYAHLYEHLLGEDLCVHHGTRRYTSVPCEPAVQSSED